MSSLGHIYCTKMSPPAVTVMLPQADAFACFVHLMDKGSGELVLGSSGMTMDDRMWSRWMWPEWLQIWFSLLIFVWLLTHSLWVANCSLYIWFIIPWNEFQAIDILLLYQISSLQSLALNFRSYVIMEILVMPSWELSRQFWPALLIDNGDWTEPV